MKFSSKTGYKIRDHVLSSDSEALLHFRSHRRSMHQLPCCLGFNERSLRAAPLGQSHSFGKEISENIKFRTLTKLTGFPNLGIQI